MAAKRMTRAEALQAAQDLRRYWLDRGCNVQAEVVQNGIDHTGNPVWAIRSDMVAGLPRDAWMRKVQELSHV